MVRSRSFLLLRSRVGYPLHIIALQWKQQHNRDEDGQNDGREHFVPVGGIFSNEVAQRDLNHFILLRARHDEWPQERFPLLNKNKQAGADGNGLAERHDDSSVYPQPGGPVHAGRFHQGRWQFEKKLTEQKDDQSIGYARNDDARIGVHPAQAVDKAVQRDGDDLERNHEGEQHQQKQQRFSAKLKIYECERGHGAKQKPANHVGCPDKKRVQKNLSEPSLRKQRLISSPCKIGWPKRFPGDRRHVFINVLQRAERRNEGKRQRQQHQQRQNDVYGIQQQMRTGKSVHVEILSNGRSAAT